MKQTRRQFVRTLFIASQAAAVGSLLPRSLFAADAKGGGLNFLIVGDWGRNGEPDQAAVARQMGIAAQAMNARFVISVGDNFYEDGVASATAPQWQASFEKVYVAPSLQVPWWVALGNHDYHGNCDAQIEYGQTSRRWKMPARYFVRTEKIDADNDVDFFHLDTTPINPHEDKAVPAAHLQSQDTAGQLTWFEAALRTSTARWKIVIGHHPIYSAGGHGDTASLVKHLLPLLEKYGVQAYFNGHDHDLQHLQAGKLNLFCSGAGSRPNPTGASPHLKFAPASVCSGFITAALAANRLDVGLVDAQGNKLYAYAVPRNA